MDVPKNSSVPELLAVLFDGLAALTARLDAVEARAAANAAEIRRLRERVKR